MKLLQTTTYYDKYSRFDYDLGRREDWSDTVKRVTEYLWTFDVDHTIDDDTRQAIYTAIFNKEIMPSMRNLAMAGPAAARQNVSSYNCSYGIIKDLYFFYEAVIILMSGSGLGYSVEKQFVDQLPFVMPQRTISTYNTLIIPDTTEGWADAIHSGIKSWISGHDLHFNFGNIRPAGTPLKIKGGRASGPSVLKTSLEAIREVILNRQGQSLRPIDVHDIMCHIAKCIVSGGVRRAAMICLFDLDDVEMMTCKSPENIVGNEQRYLANNSAIFGDYIDFDNTVQFMDNMFNSYSGEPGILSRVAIKNTLPNRRNFVEGMGCNPCFSGDTYVYTTRGIFSFKDLATSGKDVDVFTIVNGNIVVERMWHPRISGHNRQIYKVIFDDDTYIRVTENHKFPLVSGEIKETSQLIPYKDSVLSTQNKEKTYSGVPEYENKTQYYKRCEVCAKQPFIVDHEHREICVCSRCSENYHQKSPEINLDTWKGSTKVIVSVIKDGTEDVYNGTVQNTHTLFAGNNTDSFVLSFQCGEIVLRPFQVCNLSSVVCRPEDTLTTLKEKVRLATILGTVQSMSQHFPGLRKEWEQNQEEERLLGVDLNGIMDVPAVRDERILQILKQTAIDTNEEYAIKLKINKSTAITCIKPSGNSSVFLDTSPGIHTRWSDFYIRRIQLHETNPILGILQMYGVPTEPSNHLAHTYVASFPVKAPEGAITNGSFTALQQLENWKLFKEKWAEHSVSCTIAYKDNERPDITKWVFENQDIISGLSFLPKDDHVYEQAPYEKITEEQYNLLIQDFPKEVDWRILHELEKGQGDNTNASQVAACSSNKCEVVF